MCSHLNLWEEKLKKTFSCYNCLDLYHAQSVFLVFVTYFSSSLEQEQCLEKVKNSRPSASNLHNLFSTLFLLSRTWKTSNSHLEKIQTITATNYYFYMHIAYVFALARLGPIIYSVVSKNISHFRKVFIHLPMCI